MENMIFEMMMGDKLDKAIREDFKLEVKQENGVASSHFEGGALTLLVGLAVTEKEMLRKLDCSEKFFKFIKDSVGTETIKKEED